MRAVHLVVVLTLVAPARAGGGKEHDKEPRDEDRPTEKMGLKSRVFEVKHHTPDELMKVLKPLASGIKGTSLVGSGDFNTITVRDFPENVAAIENSCFAESNVPLRNSRSKPP